MDHQLTLPKPRKQPPSRLQNKIAQLYYSHGLFCASHPYSVIFVTLLILALCCYPLLRLPLLGSSSQYYTTPVEDLISVGASTNTAESFKFTSPRWFQGNPVAYVQQIVVKSAVSPWKSDLILTDAFRAPLAEVFGIRELINNHQVSYSFNHSVSLSDICLQVSEPVDKLASPVLPYFGCLFVNPSNAWKQDFQTFQQDADIVRTVFSLTDSSVDSSSLRETLFGVPWKETGIKQFNVRSRPRVITYALTLVFHSFDHEFLHSLFSHLRAKYPSNPYPDNTSYRPEEGSVFHVHFQNLHSLSEFMPLGIAYMVLFLYIYFSVRKIDLVKSKWALAISAVLTVIMSLLMSVGLCLWFGLNPTLNGSEILPYLIVVIGLENMLVLTKSIVSTPLYLDVKLRVAQGLSKEGWSITKNLFTELALLTVAFLTFVPKIQEFCLFAVVGLLTDFFLQLVFFATFLSIDIRRIEISDLHRGHYKKCSASGNSGHNSLQKAREVADTPRTVNYPSSQSRAICDVNARRKSSVNLHHSSAKVFAPMNNPMLGELPKRMKVIYFWARTRIVQRGLMVCLVMWIGFWLYTSGIVETISENAFGIGPIAKGVVQPILQTLKGASNSSERLKGLNMDGKETFDAVAMDFFPKRVKTSLKHQNLYLWQTLSPQHWTTLFGYYNISLSGRYISILPPIHLSVAVDPETATRLRTTEDVETSKKSYWQFLSSVEQSDKDIDDLPSDLPYHPSSPAEVALAIALSIPTLLFFIYLMVVLYRCMCTKHYAEWRTSWKNSSQPCSTDISADDDILTSSPDSYLITETLPVKLQAHSQEVESIVADDTTIVSCCLKGDICVWDSISGECLTSIKRSRMTKHRKNVRIFRRENGSFSSDSTYGSSPVSDDTENYSMFVPELPTPIKQPADLSLRQFDEQYSVMDTPSASVAGNDGSCPRSSLRTSFNPSVSTEDDGLPPVREVKEADNVMCSFPKHEHQLRRVSNAEMILEGAKQNRFYSPLPYQAVWSMHFKDIAIAVGCKEGRLEVWNAFSGSLDYVYDENKSGITALSISDDWLVSARLNGIIDFFVVEITRHDNSFLSCHPQEEYSSLHQDANVSESVRCLWFQSVKAHNLAISVLEVHDGFAVTGGFDRLVKVFKCDSGSCAYTLHGHSATMSALHIDKYSPSSAASGCQDGLICLWDLMTGTCMYSLNAHEGSVMTLKCTPIYLISQGTDNRICIWEKFQGHLLHSINQEYSLYSNLVLLTNNIMVTTKEDNLVLWDVNHGEALRMIMIGNGDHSCHIKLLRLSGQSVVCDYGPQMFIINFPAIANKVD